jgi:hypothetical protein
MSAKPYPIHYLQVSLILLAAAGLLLLSWPRLQASLRYLPVDSAIARYWDGATLPAGQLQALGERAREAIRIHGHYRYWDGLSLLYYLQGMDTGVPVTERRAALEASIQAALEALRRAPIQPTTWLRVAAARASLQRPAEAVRKALELSIYTGRVEPPMLTVRLEIGYAYLRSMDQEARRLLRDQTLLTWRLQEGAFIESLRSGAIRFSDVERVLVGSHNEVLAEMEVKLARVFH